MLSEELKQAIALVRSGDKVNARHLLMAILDKEPTNETAWLWFADTLNSDREKKIALDGLLKIKPDSQAALLALERLSGALPKPEIDPEAPDSQPSNELDSSPPATPLSSIEPPDYYEQPGDATTTPIFTKDKSTRRIPEWLLRTIIILFAVALIGSSMYFFGQQLGLFEPVMAECSCTDTDAYILRVEDRISRWLNNYVLYQMAETQGDAPVNTDFAQKIYVEEQNDRIPACLKDLHETLLITFEYHVKYGEALRNKNIKDIVYYRQFETGMQEQLSQTLAGISANLNQKCTH